MNSDFRKHIMKHTSWENFRKHMMKHTQSGEKSDLIWQAEYTHTGLYRCEAASVLGKAEASGTLSFFLSLLAFVFVFASFLRKVEASGILSTIKIATSNIQQKGRIRLILAKFYSNLWFQSQQILSWHKIFDFEFFKESLSMVMALVKVMVIVKYKSGT